MKTSSALSGSLMPTLFAICLLAPHQALAKPTLNQSEGRKSQTSTPEELNLAPLRAQSQKSDPLGPDFNYSEEFKTLDLEAVKKDINTLLTTPQDWWPADYGNYGPLFIRMAWHSAGTYRQADGRGGAEGGQQRFAPLNNWPDNANLDKARRLLWPVKQKYGQKISWSDLMVLTGNVAMENMGFKTLGFAGGRIDDWEPDFTYWGPESKTFEGQRFDKNRELKKPLAATQMGLIYVNPEGPNGNPDPLAAAQDIRVTFGRMGMNDEETVALIAGGHAFGKAHGAHPGSKCSGDQPATGGPEDQGLDWKNKCGKGKAEDTVTSGLEGAWTSSPVKWTTMYLDNLFDYEWKQVKSPAGATQWIPVDESAANLVPDAHIKDRFHAPFMLTTDLALKFDPSYKEISLRFRDNPKEFELAFARAWFKLTHRDLGPRARYIGADVPDLELIWQDPIPKIDHKLIDSRDIALLKGKILASGLTIPELVRTAWAASSSFRGTDMRGGANGARIRLEPQKNWAVNDPQELARVIGRLEAIQIEFNQELRAGKKVSLADTIVLAGGAAVEKAAKEAGYSSLKVPFTPGRMDASQEQTDPGSFAALEPMADGFRNYFGEENTQTPSAMLVEKAAFLNLTPPEMTVLVGGMRALNANSGQSPHGVLTDRPGTLTNDFFINLLDTSSTEWKKSPVTEGVYGGYDRKTGDLKWTATSVDLIFGSNPELRALAEVYASRGAESKFVNDFVSAWTKVMNLDRFDLASQPRQRKN